MQNLYFARQPILDREAKIDFYEVLYTERKSQEAEKGFIFESSLLEALGKIGRQSVLGKRRAFIKVDEKLLLGDKIHTLSYEFFVFALSADIELREDVIKRVHDLNERGYMLAIDDFPPTATSMSKYAKIIDEVHFVKIDFNRTVLVNEESKEIVARVKERGVSVVATNVSDKLRYEFAKSLGCLFFQGYYFSKAKTFLLSSGQPPRGRFRQIWPSPFIPISNMWRWMSAATRCISLHESWLTPACRLLALPSLPSLGISIQGHSKTNAADTPYISGIL